MKLVSIALVVVAVLLVFTDLFNVRRGMLRLWIVLTLLWVAVAGGVLAFDPPARYADAMANVALVVVPPIALVALAGGLWLLMRAAWWALRGFRMGPP
jgi:hypothetical protein